MSVTADADPLQRCACQDEAQRTETQSSGGEDLATADVSGVVDDGLASGGRPLDASTRSFMEPQFGHDFSSVRIHDNAAASGSASAVSARAYTVGSNIAFRSGKFAPGSSEGRRLLAHELTHVVQQGAASPLAPSVQRSLWLSERREQFGVEPSSGNVIQRWPFSDDNEDDHKEDNKDSENTSGGGLLDWAKEKGGAVVDTVSQAGGDVVDWAKEKGGAVVDTVSQAGGDAVDWAKEKGGAVLDTVSEGASSALLEAKKSLALSQINGAMQKLSGHETVYLTEDQIAALNGHIATLSSKSQGSINPPEVVAQADSTSSATDPAAKPVAASSLMALLGTLQASVSAPFMSPAPDSAASASNDSGLVQRSPQETLQRAAILLAPVAVGIGIAEALAIVAIVLIIALLIVAAVILISNKLKEDKEKEEREKQEKEKKEKEEEEKRNKIAECIAIHVAYKALGVCPSCKPTDSPTERAAKVACITAIVAGRSAYLAKDCDDILPGSIARGSDVAKRGHQIQLDQEKTRLLKCAALPTT